MTSLGTSSVFLVAVLCALAVLTGCAGRPPARPHAKPSPTPTAVPLATVAATDASLAELEVEANRVLEDPDNVARRAKIGPVFRLADRYAALGRTNQALHYYQKGLEHEPWNLTAQLALARILKGTGDLDGARHRAELVWNHAETDLLLMGAGGLLDRPQEFSLPRQEAWPDHRLALALVPVGPVEAWLLRELRAELSKLTGIPVIIQQLPVVLPQPRRDALHEQAEDLRKHFNKVLTNPEVYARLRAINLTASSLSDDTNVFTFAESVIEREQGRDASRAFREGIEFHTRLGPQWDANELLERMERSFAPKQGSDRGFLGVTQLDLFANSNRYVFGQAAMGRNHAAFSYRRFTSAVTQEPPNRARLLQRCLKQALSSSGLLYGVARCTDPKCARAYPNSLAEHDAKELRLCPDCRKGFAVRSAR